MIEALQSTVMGFVREHHNLGAVVVFFLGFAEGIPILSLFVPSSMLFLAIGSLQAAAGAHFVPLWLAASVGAFVGDCVTYAIGRTFKNEAPRIWPLSRNPELLVRGKTLLENWGWLAVLAGKFLGFMRPFIPIAAGILEMPVLLFAVASALSSLAWAGVFLAPGWGIARFFG
jgi:membrane protein DedA with SNARE-associated domain